MLDAYILTVREAYKKHEDGCKKQGELLETYLQKLQDAYPKMLPAQRERTYSDLEKLTEQWEDFDPISSLAVAIDGPFNPAKAKSVRRGTRSNREELAKQLGVSTALIGLYESGRAPSTPPNSRKSHKYLYWLKEQGYNPYNL